MKILSWGVGLQSTTLLEMSLSGDLPKLDVAIFSDTGFEYKESYSIFEFYASRARKAGIEVVKIGGQNIFEDTYRKVSLPLFVNGSGRQIRRKCTRDYKIRPIHRKIRELLGVKQRGRLPSGLVTLWLGITVDEIERAKDSRVGYIVHQFPLLDLRYRRGDCANYLRAKGLPIPRKSSCVFCPYQPSREWGALKREQPEQYQKIVQLEQHINKQGLVEISGQRVKTNFLPTGDLLEADFAYQQSLFGEMCEGGFCHV